MEEEVGIKVTRLRRRLSVEAEDVKSPATPTKKRGGRLAAKPQLELIDENVPEATPKKTRKSTAREVAEPVEEKVATPSRRSTRIRSNTSIVSETPDVAEEKGTPSRRSTRIKSNTSIVAETVQNVNSPRAKRAARRISQVGSDNETPVTPARQTRRTRKDSTSSVDKQAETNAGKLGSQVDEVIAEETENNFKEAKTKESPKSDSPTLRKSPRLVGKSGRKSSSLDNENKENEHQIDKDASETTTDANKSVSETKSETKNDVDEKVIEQNNLSTTTSNLIKELDEAPKKGKINMNKSTTAIEEPQVKSKRNRTKSWTTISIELSHENSFCSDSEAYKKKNKRNSNILNYSNLSGSGDGIMNISSHNDEKKEQEKINVTLNSSTTSEKKKKKGHEKSICVETLVHDVSVLNSSVKSNTSAGKLPEVNEIAKDDNKDLDNLNTSKKYDSSETEKLFEQAPSGLIQSLVYIEDSDSNQDNAEKGNIGKNFDSGDQCVPVVDHNLTPDETSKELENNVSYEPMDIDETMPENVSLSTFAEENTSVRLENQESELKTRKSLIKGSPAQNNSINKSKRKSAVSSMVHDDNIDEESNDPQRKSFIAEIVGSDAVGKDLNKSKRKSSVSNVVTEDTLDGNFNVFNGSSGKIDTENKKDNKSKRKSSILNADEDSNKSQRRSSSASTDNDQSINKGSNKKRSSLSNVTPDDDSTESSDKSIRKSLKTDQIDEDTMEKSLNKSRNKSVVVAEMSMNKRKSSISNTENDDSVNKSSNNSISKNLISESQTLDKTEQSNKSTLVLSQIKDVPENEINLELNEQLSKSVPNVKSDIESNKKNISLTYSTSTPLQQKPIKKLGMQINSSIITPSSVSKKENKNTLNASKKEAPTLLQKDDSESSEEEEDSEEDTSMEKSKMIDDEAEEASENYESGDSRDEDEKEYEEQNEIVEKGETLESEGDIEYSDDSDYEKDSFIVSSDEEDNDLLSGSGEDLSMSADELSMSAKSKKKYNERKIKEQKKASREMYEARHKLNESDKSAKSKSPKSKKNNRQRFDTSSESEEEVAAQPKKTRRQRIDSSQDISMLQSDADKSVSQKKKKAKRLSESVCDDNATNEKEISIREENQAGKIDPLALHNVVKEEPKTPQKDLNISTIAITNVDEVEEVNVNENVSVIKSNETSDPLQATIADNDDDAEEDVAEDSISENEEITQNYESVLDNLNKSNSKKTKALDISLNLNKKTKQKPKEPIVDQLNLTQVKQKKKKADVPKNVVKAKELDKSVSDKSSDKKVNTFSEGSSDSIDMKLLFPEDSNDSEVVVVKTGGNHKIQQAKETPQKEDAPDALEDFIPLKKTEGKTNLLDNTGVANKSKDESILNVSNKKKNKRKSAQAKEVLLMDTKDDDNIGFFIDTTGTLADGNNTVENISIKNSAKKNKQNSHLSFVNNEEVNLDDDSNEAPIEVSYRSEKNKSKQDLNVTQNKDETEADNSKLETPSQSTKKKKKNKKGLNNSQNVTQISMIENTEEAVDKSINMSANNEEGSSKNKKKKISESQIDTDNDQSGVQNVSKTIQNASLGSAKKLKQKSISESSAVEKDNVNKDDKDVIDEEETSKKRKRKSSANQTIEEINEKDEVKPTASKPLDESLSTINLKKKRKFFNNDEDVKEQVCHGVTETQDQQEKAVKNSKKKTKVPAHQEVDEIGDEVTKKNKKRKERDDDDASEISKVLKKNSFDKVHVPRLPANVLKQLNDKPKKDILETKKPKVISTTSFIVQEAKKKKNKPSNYLEESVYLNDDLEEKKQRGSIKNPKVLPFIPTASTSDSGFTTNFRVNIIPQQTKFVAQSSDISNFKNDYLHKKRIKKLGTFEMYKRQRNIKISKF